MNYQRILGIDFGTRRIGVAVSDPTGTIASGVAVIANSSVMFTELKRLAEQYDVKTIVVGMPFNLKGERGAKALEVEEFMRGLRDATGCDIVEWDERFTSQSAQETMRAMGMKKKQRQEKSRVDLMASALILQGYLDASKSGG
ncbi:MAG TPA: Holliday junction resolvase RuvX [Bacteroidota bacterium]|nr:Holliday junction resolvase RuvX [Bacteroidota bacterium]